MSIPHAAHQKRLRAGSAVNDACRRRRRRRRYALRCARMALAQVSSCCVKAVTNTHGSTLSRNGNRTRACMPHLHEHAPQMLTPMCPRARLHVCVPGCKPPTRAHAVALSVARTRPAFSHSACRARVVCDRTVAPRGTRLRARTPRQPLRCCKAAVGGDGMRRYDAVMVHHELDLLELRHAGDALRYALCARLLHVARCALRVFVLRVACCRAVCCMLGIVAAPSRSANGRIARSSLAERNASLQLPSRSTVQAFSADHDPSQRACGRVVVRCSSRLQEMWRCVLSPKLLELVCVRVPVHAWSARACARVRVRVRACVCVCVRVRACV
jgi:hypothetical protein